MSQSLSKLYIHLIFHVKIDSPLIMVDTEKELYSFLGDQIKSSDSQPILINGTANHIHILFVLSKNTSIAELVMNMKRNSSRWIKSKSNYYRNFSWQNGYGAFSVSSSLCEKTIKYISNQKEHHKKISFKDEYISFLNSYNIEYDENYVFED